MHSTARETRDLKKLATAHRQVATLIGQANGVLACHDVSDGGLATAVAEMCIASGRGAYVDSAVLCNSGAFESAVGQYILEIDASLDIQYVTASLFACTVNAIGCTGKDDKFVITGAERTTINVQELTHAWRGTLDW